MRVLTKTAFLAIACTIAAPLAAQSPPAEDMPKPPEAPATPAADAPAEAPSAPASAPADATAPLAPAPDAATTSASPAQPTMAAPVAAPPPARQDSYPVCSATVKDQCAQSAGGTVRKARGKKRR